jgi:hypothetical protein
MGSIGPRTKNDCAGKGQQQTTQPTGLQGVVRQKNVVMGSTGPETNNDCASEGQQQFTRQDCRSRESAHD